MRSRSDAARARWQALAATGLLICNPCLPVSQLFVHDRDPVSYGAARGASGVRQGGRAARAVWMWLAAAMAVIAFMVRPFGGMAIAGSIGAILIYDARPREPNRRDRAWWIKMMAPFGAGARGMRGAVDLADHLEPQPWDLQHQRKSFPLPFPGAAARPISRRAARAGCSTWARFCRRWHCCSCTTPRWRRVVALAASGFSQPR